MLSQLKAIANSEIDNKSSELNDISQQLWRNPELGCEEFFAHELLTTYLEKEGFTVERKTPLETSFIAKYGDNTGLKIGVLCEYDALPGIGHACGHNLIAEVGIGAALGIKAAIMSQGVTKAEVIVFGTPSEERHGCKCIMIDKGSFEEVDICMMSHPAPFEIPTPIILSIAVVRIIFYGKASHAAAAPWEGINALDAAVLCYNSVSMLRQQMKTTCRIHGVFLDGGSKPNIIPERSEMIFDARGTCDDDTFELLEKLKNAARGAALTTGCTVEFIEDSPFYSSMKTNETLINLYVENAKSVGVVFNDEEHITKMMVSTDMGNVSKIKPSIHPFIKIKTEGGNHTSKFTEATGHEDNQLPTLNSAKSIAMTAVDILCNIDLMKNVKADFER